MPVRWLIAFLLVASLPLPALATTYYMSTTGSDGNSGASGSPWATPNHAVNCGDTIQAAAGTYAQLLNWGTVTCAAGNNVAWLTCATFDACKISVTTGGQFAAGIQIGTSYWGVQGWEVSVYSGGGGCFFAYPATSTTSIHHLVFANDICNGAGQSGFEMSNNGAAGVDYFAAVGDIAYNSAQGSGNCTSGFNSFTPVAADSLPGTHIYFAGSFAFDNVEPASCAGTAPTDGQGFFFDTTTPYAQQMVMDNNIAVFNGGSGIKSFTNSGSSAKMIFRHNTTYGNETGAVNGGVCAEIALQANSLTEVYGNLAQTGAATGCSGAVALYVLGVLTVDATDHVYANYGYSAAANNSTGTGTGFSYGPSNTFANPGFANPSNPGAPSCAAFASVPACMASLIANFTPTNAAASGYGYQKPGGTQVYDPLFPRWLCNVNLPSGLVTTGCLAGTSKSGMTVR